MRDVNRAVELHRPVWTNALELFVYLKITAHTFSQKLLIYFSSSYPALWRWSAAAYDFPHRAAQYDESLPPPSR
jgi:hypothetical protein